MVQLGPIHIKPKPQLEAVGSSSTETAFDSRILIPDFVTYKARFYNVCKSLQIQDCFPKIL